MTGITIAVKETIELLRDFKTIVVALVVPLVLFPLTFAVVNAAEGGQTNDSITVGAVSLPNEILLLLNSAAQIRVQQQTREQAQQAFERGDFDVILSGESPDGSTEGNLLEVVFDSSRRASLRGRTVVTALYEQYETNRKDAVLASTGYRSAATITERDAGPGANVAVTATLLPLLLLVACAISPMPSAADMGAGEKERTTLAPLLATGCSRGSILFGKLVAVSLLGIAGAASFILGVLISQFMIPDLLGGAALAFSGWPGALRVVGNALLLTLLFSALELTVSLFAASPKEAQTYLIPIIMIALAAGYLATTVDLSALGPLAWAIPVFGNAIAVRAATLGSPATLGGLLSILSTLTFIAACAVIGRRVLESERILLR